MRKVDIASALHDYLEELKHIHDIVRLGGEHISTGADYRTMDGGAHNEAMYGKGQALNPKEGG